MSKTTIDGAIDILHERVRQQVNEGYDASHDDAHLPSHLIAAAEAYIYSARGYKIKGGALWPWAKEGFKPTTSERDLIKAGALLAAAIDLLTGAGEPVKKLPPQTWAEMLGFEIMDPDGWRHDRAKNFTDPVTAEEFDERASISTIRFTSPEAMQSTLPKAVDL